MNCCHCKHKAHAKLVFNGVGYILCIACCERTLNALAGARRLLQQVKYLLQPL